MQKTVAIASGGTSLNAIEWRPPEGSSGDAFLCVHGVESHAEWFERLAQRLSESGHTILAYDRMGFGKSSGPRGDMSSRDSAIAELYAAREHLLKAHDHVHVIGLSWGAILCAYAATFDPSAFQSWNFVVPGWYPRRGRYAGKTTDWFLQIKKGAQGRFPLALKPSDFTSQPEQQAQIAADPWRNQSVTGRFLWHSARMLIRIRTKLKLQALGRANLFLAQNDAVIDNNATRRLFADIQTQHVFCREYPNTRHSLVLEVPSDLAKDLCTQSGSKSRQPLALP